MHDKPVGNITRTVKIIAPDDSIGRAIEAMQISGVSMLPVVNDGTIVGTVTEDALLDAVVSGDSAVIKEQSVDILVEECKIAVYSWTPVTQVGEVMNQHGIQVLLVVNEVGNYLGVVTRADVLGALSLTARPASVAGMATPLGVYLTTGSIRSGAGDLGLFLAGVSLMLMNYLSLGIVFGIAWLVERVTPLQLWGILTSTAMNMPAWADTVRGVMFGLAMPIFLLLMRILPLSGYHAAEHQVVHAIENGEPLEPDNVKAMPRVHPRCGTNIVAATILFVMISQVAGADIAIMITVLVLVFAWRSIGGIFQYYITTKTPNSRQLESGINAGKNLLARFRENPSYNVVGWRRIWNTGMPQVMLGVAAATLAGQLIIMLRQISF